jgi:hypothetical protein
VLSLIDLGKDVVQGKADDGTAVLTAKDGTAVWTAKEGEVSVLGGPWSCVSIPCVPAGSYQMRLTFVRTQSSHGICVVLPVGPAGTAFVIGDAETGLLLNAKTPPATASRVLLTNDQEYALDIKVLVAADQADIAVLLDEKPCYQWQGPQSALAVADWLRLKDSRCPGFGSHYATVVFKSVRLRMLTGHLTLLR